MPQIISLNDSKKIEVLAVNIGDKTYNIPLGNCLKVKDYRKLKNLKNDEDEIFNFLAQYIPEDVMDELNLGDVTEIFNTWSKATQEASGQTLGES